MANQVTEIFDLVAPSYDEVLPFFARFGAEFLRHLPADPGRAYTVLNFGGD